jgi:hypothetical protein
VPPLTIDEKMTFARWIDLGCPINWGDNGTTPWGWFLDEIRPTVAVTSPQPGRNHGPLTQFLIGVADGYKGLNLSTFQVRANFTVNGQPAGNDLVSSMQNQGGGVYRLQLGDAITMLDDGLLTVEIADNQGNINKVERKFSVGEPVSPCAPQPLPNCVSPERNSLTLARRGGTKDRLMWRWSGNDPSVPNAFGNPMTGTTSSLCIYDRQAGVPELVGMFTVGPGGNWIQRASGFAYRNRDGNADGVTSVRMTAGAGGSARVGMTARGALGLPGPGANGGMFAKDPDVTAQLVNDSGSCWEARFPEARRNEADMFVAR